jgi:hypothetical protein
MKLGADAPATAVYDAAYLELAQRPAAPLATLCQDSRAAADALGVPVLGLASDADGWHRTFDHILLISESADSCR